MTGHWELGQERRGRGQIAGGPISSLMVSKRGNMRECGPVKQVTREMEGEGAATFWKHTHLHTQDIKETNGRSCISIITHYKAAPKGIYKHEL